VCTGHCTVRCPVHRQPHAKFPFSCALSDGSPDNYCALSGVHRTGTVDCPVRPYSVFKKSFSARARGQAHFLSPLASLSLGLWKSPPRRRPPFLSGGLFTDGVQVHPLPSLVRIPLSLSFPFSLCVLLSPVKPLSSTLVSQFQIPVKSSKTKWSYVFLCVP
jgi:hypothetical protein